MYSLNGTQLSKGTDMNNTSLTPQSKSRLPNQPGYLQQKVHQHSNDEII